MRSLSSSGLAIVPDGGSNSNFASANNDVRSAQPCSATTSNPTSLSTAKGPDETMALPSKKRKQPKSSSSGNTTKRIPESNKPSSDKVIRCSTPQSKKGEKSKKAKSSTKQHNDTTRSKRPLASENNNENDGKATPAVEGAGLHERSVMPKTKRDRTAVQSPGSSKRNTHKSFEPSTECPQKAVGPSGTVDCVPSTSNHSKSSVEQLEQKVDVVLDGGLPFVEERKSTKAKKKKTTTKMKKTSSKPSRSTKDRAESSIDGTDSVSTVRMSNQQRSKKSLLEIATNLTESSDSETAIAKQREETPQEKPKGRSSGGPMKIHRGAADIAKSTNDASGMARKASKKTKGSKKRKKGGTSGEKTETIRKSSNYMDSKEASSESQPPGIREQGRSLADRNVSQKSKKDKIKSVSTKHNPKEKSKGSNPSISIKKGPHSISPSTGAKSCLRGSKKKSSSTKHVSILHTAEMSSPTKEATSEASPTKSSADSSLDDTDVDLGIPNGTSTKLRLRIWSWVSFYRRKHGGMEIDDTIERKPRSSSLQSSSRFFRSSRSLKMEKQERASAQLDEILRGSSSETNTAPASPGCYLGSEVGLTTDTRPPISSEHVMEMVFFDSTIRQQCE